MRSSAFSQTDMRTRDVNRKSGLSTAAPSARSSPGWEKGGEPESSPCLRDPLCTEEK